MTEDRWRWDIDEHGVGFADATDLAAAVDTLTSPARRGRRAGDG